MDTHRNLRVWQQSIDFSIQMYALPKDFPKDELYGMVSQMRRAVVSVPSNIAEGYVRGTNKEKLHFLRIAAGSLSELDTQLLISFRLGYMKSDEYNASNAVLTGIWKQLNALISSVKVSELNDETTNPLKD